ncbi:hypothetical protein F4X73_15250 [Candidatus Poribacteria bacterium]|nr:hypothetical protein [Candidatus Poribacteria bacterium]MYF56709.1 hypothetical protein [Candidatus Poribacteria bacterium]
MYDFVATSDDGVPVDVVNAFLSQEGYTPQVIQTYYLTRRSVQRIYLGTDVDPSPLLSGLRKLPGVLLVELDMDTGGFSDDPAAAYFDELIVD